MSEMLLCLHAVPWLTGGKKKGEKKKVLAGRAAGLIEGVGPNRITVWWRFTWGAAISRQYRGDRACLDRGHPGKDRKKVCKWIGAFG